MLDVTRPVDVATQPAMAFVSSATTQPRDSSIRRGHTISGVTDEAKLVFEHVLQRSNSDLLSSHSRQRQRPVSRRRLPVITETSNSAPGEPHHNSTYDSIDTRLSSYDGLDEVEGRPSRSSLPSADGFLQSSRDSIDMFDSKRSTGMRLSSIDGLDDGRVGSMQSDGYSREFSRDSGDPLVSSGQQTAEPLSVASMSVELADDDTDTDDESKQKEKSEKMPKKKKSLFKRVRERLRATFSRRDDANRDSPKADKYMQPDGGASRQKQLAASFRRKTKKHKVDHGSENGSALALSHPGSSANSGVNHTFDSQPANHDKLISRGRRGVFSSLQRRLSSVRVKRSQSRGSASGIQSADETSIHRHATSDAVSTGNRSMHSRQGHHSVRATLELDIQRPMRPAANAAPVIVDIEPAVSSDLEERVSNWDFIDGGVDEIDGGIDEIDGNTQPVAPSQHATTRRFSEKSPAEKEELYEHIASRLISIGDSYNISTPANPTLAGDDDECAASQSAVNSVQDVSVDLANQLLSTASGSYSTFQRVVTEAIRGEVGLQQIACMFQLSGAAMEHAGVGTQLAVSIKDMTMRYFEHYFAPWVVEQGGWESVVESTDSEVD